MSEHDEVCRDENCGLLHVHKRHEVKRRVIEPQHRSTSKRQPWEQSDPQGLLEAVVRAIGNRPVSVFADVYRDVVDDYGRVTERTVSRYLVKAVADGRIVDVDVKLPAWRVYAEPSARMLRKSPDAIREYILAEHDHPADVASRRSQVNDRPQVVAQRANPPRELLRAPIPREARRDRPWNFPEEDSGAGASVARRPSTTNIDNLEIAFNVATRDP